MDDPTTDPTPRKPTREEQKAAKQAARQADLLACEAAITAALEQYDCLLDAGLRTRYRQGQAIHEMQITVVLNA